MGNSLSLQDLDAIIARLRKVMSGDLILAEDHNDLVDAIKTIRDILAQQVGVTAVENPSGMKMFETLAKLCDADISDACDIMGGLIRFAGGLDSYLFCSDSPHTTIKYKTSDIIVQAEVYDIEYSAVLLTDASLNKMYRYLVDIAWFNYFNEFIIPLSYQQGCPPSTNYEGCIRLFAILKSHVSTISSDYVPITRIRLTNTPTAIDTVEVAMKPDGTLAIVKGQFKDDNLALSDSSVVSNINYNVKDRWLILLTDLCGDYLYLISDDLSVLAKINTKETVGMSPDTKTACRDAYLYVGYVNKNGEYASFKYDWLCNDPSYRS